MTRSQRIRRTRQGRSLVVAKLKTLNARSCLPAPLSLPSSQKQAAKGALDEINCDVVCDGNCGHCLVCD